MEKIQTIILQVNPFAFTFKMMREVEQEEQQRAALENRAVRTVMVMFSENPEFDRRRYNAPQASEIAVVFVSREGEPPTDRNVVVHNRQEGLKENKHGSSQGSNCVPVAFSVWRKRLAA